MRRPGREVVALPLPRLDLGARRRAAVGAGNGRTPKTSTSPTSACRNCRYALAGTGVRRGRRRRAGVRSAGRRHRRAPRRRSAAWSDYGHHQRVGYDVACNWKIYVDNYLEGYHVPHVHPALNRMLDYRSYVTETSEWHSLQWSPLESDDTLYGNGDALYYWLWPNTMLNILPGRLQTNRVVPLGVDRCRVEFDFYYASTRRDDSGEARAKRDADLAVQRRGAARGPRHLRGRAARPGVGLLRRRAPEPAARERRASFPGIVAACLPRGHSILGAA